MHPLSDPLVPSIAKIILTAIWISEYFFPTQAVYDHIGFAIAVLNNDFRPCRTFNNHVLKHHGLGTGIAVLVADKTQRIGAN
ncbi:hypothetical protein ACI3PL_23300, partial [Lacticaseibacillus paracasei]